MTDSTRSDNRLDELISAWRFAKLQGKSVEIDELCRDCPELTDALRKAVSGQDELDRLAITTADFHELRDDASPDVRLPGYEIVHVLGRGGMGVVFLARQQGLKRLVAIKMILAGGAVGEKPRARFVAEAEMLARLRHPNIVQIFAFGEHQGSPYFVMEYVAGGSLVDRIKLGPMDPREAATLMADVADAVHAAHQIGIIHRDLKPGNILLDSSADETNDRTLQEGAPPANKTSSPWKPRLTDFGLARNAGSGENLTVSGIAMGTPAYMAPEQALGHSEKFGPGTDIFALGTVLYECLTGVTPFRGPSDVQTMQAVVRADPKPPSTLRPDLPKVLDSICLMCLRKLPKNRYETAADLAADLRRFLANEHVLAKPLGIVTQIARKVRRRPVTTGVLLAFLAGVLFTLAVLLLPFRQNQFSDDHIRAKAGQLRHRVVDQLLKSRRPNGWFPQDLSQPDGPSDAWAQFHAIASLLESREVNESQLRLQLMPSLMAPFSPSEMVEGKGIAYGWSSQQGRGVRDALAAPAQYAVTALANGFHRHGIFDEAARPQAIGLLTQTQALLAAVYRPQPFDGGWSLYPHQTLPRPDDPFATVTSLRMLLALRRANLGWEGSTERRDVLLNLTIQQLMRELIVEGDDPGWRASPFPAEPVNEGLTLEILALLLQANAEAQWELPTIIEFVTEKRLERIASAYWGRHPDMAARLEYTVAWPGEDPSTRGQTITCLWYPWAIATATRWQQYANVRGDHAEVRRCRRLLSSLIVDQGDRAVEDTLQSWLFKPAELLEALNGIP